MAAYMAFSSVYIVMLDKIIIKAMIYLCVFLEILKYLTLLYPADIIMYIAMISVNVFSEFSAILFVISIMDGKIISLTRTY